VQKKIQTGENFKNDRLLTSRTIMKRDTWLNALLILEKRVDQEEREREVHPPIWGNGIRSGSERGD